MLTSREDLAIQNLLKEEKEEVTGTSVYKIPPRQSFEMFYTHHLENLNLHRVHHNVQVPLLNANASANEDDVDSVDRTRPKKHTQNKKQKKKLN